MVFVCSPNDNLGRKLSYLILHVLCAGGICGGCRCVLWLSSVIFDVLDHFFVVVFGCGPIA